MTDTTSTSVLTEVQALSLPDMAVMTRSASSALRMAQTFVITSEDDYQLAGEELQTVKAKIKGMEATRVGITGPMNKALSAINDLFRGPMETLKSAETGLKGSMLAYYTEQERIATEVRRVAEAAAAAERQRLAEEARKIEQAAAEERQRLAQAAAAVAAAAQAEQDRLAAEAAKAAAEGNAAAAEAANKAAEASREKAQMEAKQARERDEEAANTAYESASAIRHELAVTSAAVTHIDSAKAAGTSVRVAVDFEVKNLLALVQHVAKNPELISLLVADSVKLRGYVKGLGMNTNLPGVHVFQKRSMSARAA